MGSSSPIFGVKKNMDMLIPLEALGNSNAVSSPRLSDWQSGYKDTTSQTNGTKKGEYMVVSLNGGTPISHPKC